MVKLRDIVPDAIKKVGKRLKKMLRRKDASERQAEAARRRFEKAVFHSQYTVDQFEKALDEHRQKMLELGKSIGDCVDRFYEHWEKAEKLGPFRSKHHKAAAKAWFERILALQERIDAHLSKFEEKLDILTAWRQYKIQNDIGAKVDVEEVKQFMAEELDQLDHSKKSLKEREVTEMTDKIRIGPQDTISEGEQEMFDEFVEKEFENATDDEIDEEIAEFLEKEEIN